MNTLKALVEMVLCGRYDFILNMQRLSVGIHFPFSHMEVRYGI